MYCVIDLERWIIGTSTINNSPTKSKNLISSQSCPPDLGLLRESLEREEDCTTSLDLVLVLPAPESRRALRLKDGSRGRVKVTCDCASGCTSLPLPLFRGVEVIGAVPGGNAGIDPKLFLRE